MIWNKNTKLIISDVDDTVSEVFKCINPEMVKEITKLLLENRFILLLSGQGFDNIYNRVISLFDKSLFKNILVGHCNGAEVLGFDEKGNLLNTPIFSINNLLDDNIKQKRNEIIAEVISECNLLPYTGMDIQEFKRISKGNPKAILLEDRSLQVTFDFVNIPKIDCISTHDMRVPIISHAKNLFEKYKLPIEPRLGGQFAVDFVFKGVNKSLPITRFLLNESPFILDIPGKISIYSPKEIEIWGDTFAIPRGGSDSYMCKPLPKETRAISFRKENPNDFFEGYNIQCWTGNKELSEGLLEYLQTRNKDNNYE